MCRVDEPFNMQILGLHGGGGRDLTLNCFLYYVWPLRGTDTRRHCNKKNLSTLASVRSRGSRGVICSYVSTDMFEYAWHMYQLL